MRININWTKANEIYQWINQINNAFNFRDVDIFESNTFEIISKSRFIPIHMLILLWYHIYYLESKRKKCIFMWKSEVSEFLWTCWLKSFINTERVNNDNLRDSVILPFSKLSTPIDCQKYLDKFANRVSYEIKYEIIDQIWELHNNAIIHWNTQDIFVMGQYYPSNKSLHIIVYDWWNWILNYDIDEYIWKIWDKYSSTDYRDKIINKFWKNTFFIILCICTNFSTRWPTWWMGLIELSRFLFKNSWIIHIASWKVYLNIKFKKICSKIDKDSAEINYNALDNNLKWTYISFTFSI